MIRKNVLVKWLRRYPMLPDAAICMTVFAAVLWWRRFAWLDPYVDFGRELYVPWRLSEGAVLYRDIAYHAGPLTPYLNAGLFSVFGVSINVLIVANGIIAAGAAVLLHRLMWKIAGRVPALISVLVFLLLFLSPQYHIYGNFNWLTPYSHEMTQGTVVALLAILIYHSVSHKTGCLRRASVAGVLIGFVFLTKPEIFLAGVMAYVALFCAGFIHLVHREKQPIKCFSRQVLCWLIGLLIPPAIAMLAFSRVMPVPDAVAAAAGAWRYVFGQDNLDSLFFRRAMGTHDVMFSIRRMLEGVLMLSIICAVALGLGRLGMNLKRRKMRVAGAIVWFLASLLTYLFVPGFDRIWRCLPIVVAGIAFVSAIRLWRLDVTIDTEQGEKYTSLWVFSVFSLVLLFKIILNAQPMHYGFTLALPATLLFVTFFVRWLPEIMHQWTGFQAILMRSVLCGLVVGIAANRLDATWTFNRSMTDHLQFEGQRIRWFANLQAFDLALNQVNRLIEADATLVVIPENELMNFLLQRRNPSPYGNFNPHQVQIFGEVTMINRFKQSPPDYIVFMDQRYTVFEVGQFGLDYAIDFGRWIRENYVEIAILADNPLYGARAPILLLRRREHPFHSED